MSSKCRQECGQTGILHTAAGEGRQVSRFGNQSGYSSKSQTRASHTTRQFHAQEGTQRNCKHILDKHTYTNAHSEVETTRTSISWWINVRYTYNGIVLSNKKRWSTDTCYNIDELWKPLCCPDWCGSVGWVSFCKVKGCWFNSPSGRMPGFRVLSPVGECETGHRSMFLSLSFSLPSSLSKNNLKKKKKSKAVC